MPRLTRVRAVPWMIVLQSAHARRRALAQPDARRAPRLKHLIVLSRGAPGNLSPEERNEVRDIAARLDSRGLRLGPRARRQAAGVDGGRRIRRDGPAGPHPLRARRGRAAHRASAGWPPGCSTPTRTARPTRTGRSRSRRRTSRARCTWAMRSTARSRTRSSAGTGCAGERTKWILGTDHAGHRHPDAGREAARAARARAARSSAARRSSSACGSGASSTAARSSSSSSASAPPATTTTSASRSTRATSAAVLEVFVALYDKGLIYRDHYMVNWDPGSRARRSATSRSRSARSTTHLYSIAYPLADGGGELVVATVRPETMLADTAVAVHPDDERYAHLSASTAILPLVGPRAADHRRRRTSSPSSARAR